MGKICIGMLLCFMMLASCGEDVDIFIPNTQQAAYGQIHRLTSRLQQDMAGDVKYTIPCPCFGNQVFEIDKDLVLDIPPGFVDLNQYPCTNGFFNLEVTVCDEKGEILVNGIPTLSNQQLLESRIEMDIKIKNGDQRVPLAHGKQFHILVNDPDPIERMELFYGNGDDWIEADNDPNSWATVNTGEWFFQIDSTQEFISGFGYESFSDSTDWINVDVFFNIPEDQRTPVCVQLPAEYTNTNTDVFMVFRDYNSVLQMRGEAEIKEFCEPYGATPVGFRVTFVVLSEHGEDNYFFATKDVTITPNMTETLVPVKTPYNQILTYMKQL